MKNNLSFLILMILGMVLTGCSQEEVISLAASSSGYKAPFMVDDEWWLSQGSNDHANAWDFNWGNGSDDLGRPVLATCSGQIASVYAGGDDNGGWGRTVIIECSAGKYFRTAHHDEVFVQEGQYVTQGQVVATNGTSGKSTGPHIHAQFQNSASGGAVDESFSDIGDPQSGARVTSSNSFIIDDAVERNGGGSKLGSIQHTNLFGSSGIHWYHGEDRPDGEDVYVQNREGGEYNQPSGMIYDALGGARRAYYARTAFWSKWTEEGGPHSWLGSPITDEYWNGDGQARQDFKKGYLYWSSNGGTTTNYYPIATPGWYDSGWDNSKSYAFAEAYERCNARNTVGEAMNTVHGWGDVEVQNFNWGSYGDCAIIYCPFYHEAYLVRTGFWIYYTQNGGPNSFGYPCGEEYGRGGEAVQEFQKAVMYWNGSASVEWKSGNDYGCSTSNGSNGLSDMINDVPDMGGPQFGGPDDYDPFADGDHDGYSGDYDCNDNDASINPGADENCNDGVDNDCDWLVDSDDSDCPEEEHEDPDYGDDDDAANDDDDDDTSDPAADADNDGYSAGEDCNDSDPDVHPDAISSAYPEGFWQQGNSGELCWNSWDGNNWGCIPAGYHNRGNMNWYLPYEGQQALDCACDGNLDGSYGCWAETASSLAYTNCWSGNGIYITYDPAYLPAC